MAEDLASSISRIRNAHDPDDFGRARINFEWVWKLRWAAVIGQLLTVFVVEVFLGVSLPVAVLVFIIVLTAVSNVIFGAVFSRALATGRFALFGDEGEWLSGIVTAADIVFLTALLYTTGGWKNPFTIFYFVHLVLGAVVLPHRWTWGLTALSVSCYAALCFAHWPLNVFDGPQYSRLYLYGMLTAFSGAAAIIVYFVTRVGGELEQRERELESARQRRARVERVEALVTLAAGAAHELSTPLSTIAVVARELEHEIVSGPVSPDLLRDDVALIRREVTRCRAILEQMSENAGDMVGEGVGPISVRDFLDAVLDPLHAGDRLRVELDPAAAEVGLDLPREAMRRAVRGLVKNALDASSPRDVIRVSVIAEPTSVLIEVIDQGEGMDSETLARAEDPFFTTKEPGRGMGLGLFLARSVIERVGGNLSIESTLGRGTRARVRLPATP